MTVTITEPGTSWADISLHVYPDIEQGSDAWYALRCGLPTASIIGQLVTAKTFKPAENDTSRTLTNLLVSERITGIIEPMHESSDMLRGKLDEPFARAAYSEHYAPVTELGFMVGDWGNVLGYSPDGLVGDDGLIEIKSRAPKKHLATILADEVPPENIAQCQAGLLVSGRKWLDYVSFCGGMPLWTKRVEPDPRWQTAIIAAVDLLEKNAAAMLDRYMNAVDGLPPTTRLDHFADGITL